MNSRGRYPPGIGGNRGGNVAPSPNYQQRNAQQQQQYGQRNYVQSNQQFQQQHQWLRRNQSGGVDSSVEEVEKTVQSEAVDSRYIFAFVAFILSILVC